MLSDFIEHIAQFPFPCVWYAFNASYDWRYILPWLLDNQIKVEISMRTESDIYQIVFYWYEEKIVMRDAAALFKPGTKLEDFAKSFTPEIPKLKIDIEHFNPENPEHINYALRDVEILASGMPRLDSLLKKHFGVTVGHTAAGTAMKAWQDTIPEGVYYKVSKFDEREEFIRSAYYGGLVFLTRNDRLIGNAQNPVAKTFDINSSYPSVMLEYGVPDGRIIETLEYHQELMGIYKVRIKSPDNLIIPIIPGRNESGAMRWQRGEFDTVVTNRELIFAVNHGYEIQDIYSGFVFEETIFPFTDFINKCRDIRRRFKKLTEEELAKLMQNSLYGKFGARRERISIFMPETDNDIIGAIPLNNTGLWVKVDFHEGMKCRPEWAVFITAHARLKLLQNAYSVGPENCLYGDTDSLTILSGFEHGIDIGDDYGQFKLEKQWQEFRAVAPKVYAGILTSGQYAGAAKGLPRKNISDKNWLDLLETGKSNAQALSLGSLIVGIKKGLKPAEILERVSSSLDNSVNYEILTDGRVRPKLAA